jgi:acylphosphatase
MSADQRQHQLEHRKAFKIHGRVQGVGFRWWARHQARSLGLRGSVRNSPDGTVEIVLAGPPQAVDDMTERLKVGPPAAHVRRLEEIPPPSDIPADFEIGF